MIKNFVNTVIIDVDGTLTDGNIIVSSNGDSLLKFSIKDGLSIRLVYLNNIRVVILSGSNSAAIAYRMSSLGLDEKYVFLGVDDKANLIANLIKKEEIDPMQSLYIGDDINDFEAMQLVKYRACPLNSNKKILEVVDYISIQNSGEGSVRNILEFYFPELF